ncbi:hypothetical protein [Cerasicoccus maritimus]|uniref:hypothetical protein n=1 Tax=Cerasicoccus maritimus TaxID=490089 RepID=UPI002852B1F6|nr:hypothetical protein [Cerasicoccus maritimus]
MIKTYSTLFTAILCLATSAIHAQNYQRDKSQKVCAVLLENRSVSKALYYKDIMDEYRAFHVGTQSRGGGNIQPLSNRLNLYTKGLDQKGEVVYTPAISLEIPPVEQVLVVFYYDNKRDLNFQVYDDTAEAHPPGTGRLINLTKNNVVGKIGDQAFKLRPWSSMLSDVLTKEKRTRFQFGYVMDIDGKYNADPSIDTFRIPNSKMRWLAIFTYFDYKEQAGKDVITTRLPKVVRMLDAPLLPEKEQSYSAMP